MGKTASATKRRPVVSGRPQNNPSTSSLNNLSFPNSPPQRQVSSERDTIPQNQEDQAHMQKGRWQYDGNVSREGRAKTKNSQQGASASRSAEPSEKEDCNSADYKEELDQTEKRFPINSAKAKRHSEILNMSPEARQMKLKSLEEEIKENNSSSKKEKLFEEKMQIMSVGWEAELLEGSSCFNWGEYDTPILDRFLQNRDPSTSVRKPQLVRPFLPHIETWLQKNETEIRRLEKAGETDNQKALQNLVRQRIEALIFKTKDFNISGNYFEAVQVAKEWSDYIGKLALLWKKSPPVIEVDMDPYRTANFLFEDSLHPIKTVRCPGKLLFYFQEYLMRDLEEADQFRGSPTPRNEYGKGSYEEPSTYDNPAIRKNLIDEFRKSPFLHLILRAFGLEYELDIEAVNRALNFFEVKGSSDDLIWINNLLDFLSDLANYEGDFRSIAEAFEKIVQMRQVVPIENFTENFIRLQGLIKRLLKATSESAISECEETRRLLEAKCLVIQNLLENKKGEFKLTLTEGRIAYRVLVSQAANIRKDARSLEATSQTREEALKKEESKILPGGPLGRRMQMLINQVAFGYILNYQDRLDRAERLPIQISLEIDEELLKSDAIKRRIDNLRESEAPFKEEQILEDKYEYFLEDEFPEGDPTDEECAEFCRNLKIQDPKRSKQRQPTKQAVQKPAGEPTPPTTAGSSTRPKTTGPRSKLDRDIEEIKVCYFKKELDAGKKKYGIPCIVIETAMHGPLLYDTFRLEHFFRRHYSKTFDPTLAKAKNSILDSSIVREYKLKPLFRNVIQNLHEGQLKAYFAKVKSDPNLKVTSRIKSWADARLYNVEVLNNPETLNHYIMSIYPEKGDLVFVAPDQLAAISK